MLFFLEEFSGSLLPEPIEGQAEPVNMPSTLRREKYDSSLRTTGVSVVSARAHFLFGHDFWLRLSI